MKFQTLSDLLDEGPVTLVLGAGSSKDYGLPTWDELKEGIIKESERETSELNISQDVAITIAKTLRNEPDHTLDSLAGRLASMPGQRHTRSGLQKMVAKHLLEKEDESRTIVEPRWIEKLARGIQDYLRNSNDASPSKSYEERLKRLSQIRIVSLNYDRVCQSRIIAALESELNDDFLTWHDINVLNRRSPRVTIELLQPHGTLGAFPETNRNIGRSTGEGLVFTGKHFKSVTFNLLAHSPISEPTLVLKLGETSRLFAECKKTSADGEIGLNIAAVDDFIAGADTRNYERVNAILPNSHIVCIGLSEAGFNQSLLDFSKAHSATFTNTSAQLDQFDHSRLPTNDKWHFEQDGIYASPLIEKLTDKKQPSSA